MFARLLILFYAIVSYAVFSVSSLYAVGFVGNYRVPKSIDTGSPTGLGEAIVVDLLLLGIFAIQHSIMARPAFKRWWGTILPAACQRSTYVLFSSLLLLLLFWQWRPIPIQVWQVDGIAAWLLIGVYWLGWCIMIASTFMIDHFDLTGLRQAFFALRGNSGAGPIVQDAAALQGRAASDDAGPLARILGYARDDRRPFAVRHREHGLHPGRGAFRGTGFDRRVRRGLSAVSRARSHALAAHLRSPPS